jgi:hypothetical protein
VEIVDGHEHIVIEWGAFESQNWAVVTLTFIGLADELTFCFLFFGLRASFGSFGYCPVDKNKISFVGSGIESRGHLVCVEKNTADTKVD